MSNATVYVRNAIKSYDRHNIVLDNLSMTVPKGSIYGLLGASGCGKTTILNCIVGRNQLNSGELWVLGGKPGTVDSGVPGPRLGYMPQDVALCEEFTVRDSIYFFGRLMGMKDDKIRSRFKQLSDLLELPPKERIISDCSGGQKRRISFAVALIHQPELLILDEPTAGVDPLLRERIWNFLRETALAEKTTVIITTHYIEETRKADMIGLMRCGKLIAEAEPTTLLQTFHLETLEEVFLVLSQKQENERNNTNHSVTISGSSISMYSLNDSIYNYSSQEQLFYQKPLQYSDKVAKKKSIFSMDKSRLTALMDKNWKQFYRNISGWVFVLFTLPVLCSILFMLVIGTDLKGLRLIIVNQDSSCEGDYMTNSVIIDENSTCHLENLGCRYVKYLESNEVFDKKYTNNLSEALEGVKKGNFLAAIYLPKNHSLGTELRINTGGKATSEEIDWSEIKVYMDMSDYVLSLNLKKELTFTYIKYLREVFKDCNYPNYIERTLHVESIYASEKVILSHDMVPGFFITFVTYIATLLTTQIIIGERLGGIWDRSAVAGVTVVELVLTHFILQFFVMLFQLLEIYVALFVIFDVPIVGSFMTAALIAVLNGINGMVYGFLVSIISFDDYLTANILISGGFYPMILIGGFFWPIESQPTILQWISKATPFTIPAESFRYVMTKGWDLTNWHVLQGITVELVWIFLLTSISIHVLKNKQ